MNSIVFFLLSVLALATGYPDGWPGVSRVRSWYISEGYASEGLFTVNVALVPQYQIDGVAFSFVDTLHDRRVPVIPGRMVAVDDSSVYRISGFDSCEFNYLIERNPQHIDQSGVRAYGRLYLDLCVYDNDSSHYHINSLESFLKLNRLLCLRDPWSGTSKWPPIETRITAQLSNRVLDLVTWDEISRVYHSDHYVWESATGEISLYRLKITTTGKCYIETVEAVANGAGCWGTGDRFTHLGSPVDQITLNISSRVKVIYPTVDTVVCHWYSQPFFDNVLFVQVDTTSSWVHPSEHNANTLRLAIDDAGEIYMLSGFDWHQFNDMAERHGVIVNQNNVRALGRLYLHMTRPFGEDDYYFVADTDEFVRLSEMISDRPIEWEDSRDEILERRKSTLKRVRAVLEALPLTRCSWDQSRRVFLVDYYLWEEEWGRLDHYRVEIGTDGRCEITLKECVAADFGFWQRAKL